jgi:glycosyltransferase involved in cell wall biosynthesis
LREEVVVFSPLPPARSGIAEYVSRQLPLLGQRFDVRCVVEGEPGSSLPGVAIDSLRSWRANPRRKTATPVYHIGNNPDHGYVYEEHLANPGIVVLHDFVLHHLVVELTLARGDERRYRDLLVAEYGELGDRVAQQRQNGLFTEFQQFLMPLNRAVLERAAGAIVHSRWALRRVQAQFPELPAVCIPHHHHLPRSAGAAGGEAALHARRALGIPDETLVFGAFGFVTPPKCVDLAIAALSALRDRLPDFRLLIAGECADSAGLLRELARAGLEDRSIVTGYLSTDAFEAAVLATDIVFNLRYPTAGESSGTLASAVSAGKCAVVFDYAAFADYPCGVVTKVPLDTATTSPLEEALWSLATDNERRRAQSERAAEYAQRHASLEACVERYGDFVDEVRTLPTFSL